MTNEMMKELIEQYAKECSKIYKGGEKYFNEIDTKIKSNKELLLSYIKKVIEESGCKNILLSGSMFDTVTEAIKSSDKIDCVLYKVNGNLRSYKGKLLCPIEFSFIYNKKDFVFIDDSYYSGKTFKCVKDYINSAGGKVIAAYVFYDGSREKADNVHSLYRYYGNEPRKEEEMKKVASENSIKNKLYIDRHMFGMFSDVISSTFNVEVGNYVDVEVVTDEILKEKRIVITKHNESDEFNEMLNKVLEFFSTMEHLDYNQKQMKVATDKMREMMKEFTDISKNGD